MLRIDGWGLVVGWVGLGLDKTVQSSDDAEGCLGGSHDTVFSSRGNQAQGPPWRIRIQCPYRGGPFTLSPAMSSPAQLHFPSTDSDSASTSSPVSSQQLVPHLPFRRISLPPPPNLNLNRQSVVSFASFESLPDHGTSLSQIVSPTKKFKSKRTSTDAHRKGVRRCGHQAPDKERDAKRRKVIQEFYETERTYVQGLDLIYEVSQVVNLATLFVN